MLQRRYSRPPTFCAFLPLFLVPIRCGVRPFNSRNLSDFVRFEQSPAALRLCASPFLFLFFLWAHSGTRFQPMLIFWLGSNMDFPWSLIFYTPFPLAVNSRLADRSRPCSCVVLSEKKKFIPCSYRRGRDPKFSRNFFHCLFWLTRSFFPIPC